ncbi:MAG: GerMN domain-containing protein [Clostridiales bacterium]|nr:GerMN domain-containing protein [Clostridiales bacterium]
MRLKRVVLLLCCYLLPFLTGCSFGGKYGQSTHIKITYLENQNEHNKGETFLSEDRVFKETDKQKLVSLVLDALNKPRHSSFESPFKNGIKVMTAFTDGNNVTVDLSENFQTLTGIQKSIIEASIVQSLCSIDGIDYVRITSGNKPINGRKDRYLSSFDLVFSTDYFANTRYDSLLYLPEKEQNGLVSERKVITPKENESLEQAIAKELLFQMTKQNEIPENTKLLSAETKNSICYLNFSDELSGLDKQICNLVLYSFVDTICSLDHVQGVQFNINGKTIESISSVSTLRPIQADYSLTVNGM